MIYVTGDTHREIDISKLNTRRWSEQKTLTKSDYLIICGDFGCVWDGSGQDEYWLDWYESKPFTTLFVDGNHENFALLNAYPVVEIFGGKAHQLRPSVYHLMRGEVFALDGKKLFAMGGAQSTDKEHRKEGVSWWAEELPSESEYQSALSNLDKHEWRVDYVLTHCAPDSIQYLLAHWYKRDKITNFLETVRQDLHFDKWFFGHYHVDRTLNENFVSVYDKILLV